MSVCEWRPSCLPVLRGKPCGGVPVWASLRNTGSPPAAAAAPSAALFFLLALRHIDISALPSAASPALFSSLLEYLPGCNVAVGLKVGRLYKPGDGWRAIAHLLGVPAAPVLMGANHRNGNDG